MPQSTYAIVTVRGAQKIAAALAAETAVDLTHIAIGDSATVPSGAETKLYNEVARKTISGQGVVTGALNTLYADIYLAANDGPYTIREAGLFDSVGELIAIAHFEPPIAKPVPSSGQTVEGTIRIQLAVSNASAIAIVVDPSISVALQRLSVLPWIPIVSMTTAAPPANPVLGDTYLIPAGATGSWAASVGKIAEFTSAGWAMIAPRDGHGIGLPDGSTFVRVGGVYIDFHALRSLSNIPVDGYLSSAPGSPSEGGQFLIAPNPTGIWTGRAGQIARWIAGIWRYEVPRDGRMVSYWTGARQVELRYDGTAWAEFLGTETASGLLSLTTVRSTVRDELLITTPVTKTVHGAGADFPTLQAAIEWLSKYRITSTGTVTFQLSPGVAGDAPVYDGPSAIVRFNHPDGQRVFLKGAAMIGTFPARSAWTVTGFSAAARASDGMANLAMLRSRFASEMRFVNGAYIDFQDSVNVQDILFTGDGQAADGVYFRFGFASAQRVAAHGFGARGIVVAAEYVGTSAMSGSGCGVCGITVEVSGSLAIEGGPALGMGCGSAGIRSLSAGSVRCQAGATLHACGNAGAGVLADKLSAVIALPGSTADTNGSSGWVANDSSLIQAEGTSATANAGYGYFADGLSRIIANTANGGGNTTGGIRAQSGSVNTATGATGSLSPAANTVGNNNAINLQ